MNTGARGRSGVVAIEALFQEARSKGRAAFLPYYPIGYPDFETSLRTIQAMAQEDVDGFEIGIPFSDPLADGPVIQAATTRALEEGITVPRCLEAVELLRERGVRQPMLLMGYLNPILAYGPDRFVIEARRVGADGIIVPDLPPEERRILAEPAAREELAVVAFITPNAGEGRIAVVSRSATGFVYVVSVTGVTGARETLSEALPGFLERVRAHTDKPLVVGFGIGTPAQARAVSEIADGFIVGSALVRAAERGVEAVQSLTRELRRALG